MRAIIIAGAAALATAAQPPHQPPHQPPAPPPAPPPPDDWRRSPADTIGILNATQPGACPGVDAGGAVDVTLPLQACIEKAYRLNQPLLLPPGRYLVSDTLTAAQADGGAITPFSPAPAPVNVVPGRFRPNVLIGSAVQLPQHRPTIVLKADSPGFGNRSALKNVLKVTNPAAENSNMNQAVRGIDFEVQSGNPGALALYFEGAQGGVVQDVTVRLAPDAFAGLGGGGGAGTSHMNVQVFGGVHGVYFTMSDGAPLLGNAQLHNQSGPALVFTHGGPLLAVGVHIGRAAGTTGPAILAGPDASSQGMGGQVTILDSVVECAGGGAGGGAGGATTSAVSTSASLYIKNMWSRGCGALVQHPGSRHAALMPPLTPTGAVPRGGWSVVHELARGVDTSGGRRNDGVNLTMDVIYRDGKRMAAGTITNVSAAASTVLGPPAALLGQHVLWQDAAFPSFESPSTVNAVVSCGVTGDGETDDEPALSACLRKHKDVFLPKGYFRLGKTLELQPENRLVGLSQTHSVLMPMSIGRTASESDASARTSADGLFRGNWSSRSRPVATAVARLACTSTPQPCPSHPGVTFCASDSTPHQCSRPMPHKQCPPCPRPRPPPPPPPPLTPATPVVRTAAGSAATLAFLGINSWWHLPMFTLDWRSKAGLWRSNYETRVCECLWLANFRQPTTPCTTAIELGVPKTQVKGTGSFVNYVSDEDILMTDRVNYRHLHVSGVGGSRSDDRLRFYEANFEHAQSQANFEVSNSSHVDVYGIKLEGSTTIMWIRDSHDVNLWGLGGAGDSFPGDPATWTRTTYKGKQTDFKIPSDVPRYNASTIRVERTDKYKLVNLINGDRGGLGVPVSQIHPIPLTPKLLSAFAWPPADIPKIIASEWTPWPGWRIPPSLWSVAGEMDGEMDGGALLSTPMDRPVLFDRGHV
eukprot:SAG22_NODE_475_length_10003_cov_3.943356_2_plen_925_part_00